MSQRSTLDLRPFRATHYATDRVGDLAAVTSLPYDMIDAETTRRLRSTPYNIAHLILPPDAATAASAADRLREWRASGVLITEPEPGFYVYEQRRSADGAVLQRGVLGALALRAPDEGAVHPHEGVMAGPVAGRLALLRACQANLEPLLLSYDGEDGDGRAIIRHATERRPLVEAATADGVDHRVWPVTAPEEIATIRAELQRRQALICDGHHRYAAALGYQAEQHAVGHGAGPWDFVLALLVDENAHPMQVTAIHRVVERIDLAGVRDRITVPAGETPRATSVVPEGFDVTPFGTNGRTALDAFERSDERAAILATDGKQWMLIAAPRSTPLGRDPYDRTLLDEEILRTRLGIAEEQVRYVHGWDPAVHAAVHGDGVAFLLKPIPLSVVAERARRGELMPRKSTSFGPKARTGLILRVFGD